MDDFHAQLIEDLGNKRMDRYLKWTHVARELNITPQHLLRIRQGKVPITEDVAARFDVFLERPRGDTWNRLQRVSRSNADDSEAGEPNPATTPSGDTKMRLFLIVAKDPPQEWPADMRSQVAGMSVSDITEVGRSLGRQFGSEMELQFLLAALNVKKQAVAAREQDAADVAENGAPDRR
ncbi:hypothetical protein CU254_14880 [Amycolatopsis sp. AA4]|uniref:hypothetical protein n=1 Tax=Actinomycetes TaxID=1760 RepID=UPI0001DEE4CB|nr:MULTISPECIES: hypothetical protein [Actinomycetes]ATY11600.1 hypothetical protein CU254_14880 [Amycolatopsis sp. AA4]EFL07247.1 predicted protein [Streptomyces sp. AA4]